MRQYHELLETILNEGETRLDRTNVGTISTFGKQLKFNLQEGFPAVTTKKLAWKAVVGELLWFLEGSDDERRLAEITHGTREGVATIWTANSLSPYWKKKAKFEGDVGRIYGVNWRHWRKQDGTEVDQLANLIDGLKKDPNSRRHVVISYNPGEIDQVALPPCHSMFQMYVSNNKLSCQMYQRSGDAYLGIPFNIASYALLTHMIAQVCNLEVGELILVFGDTHLYLNSIDAAKEQLTREPYPLPKLWLNPSVTDIDEFTMDDIKLIGYQSHSQLKVPMAV